MDVEPGPFRPLVDEEAMAQRVALLLAPQFQTLLEAIQKMPRGVGSQPHVEEARTGPASSRRAPVIQVDDTVPVFIPSKIGRDDLQPTFEVQATKETEGDVSDALEALKAARQRKTH
jgi:hypothetical protein